MLLKTYIGACSLWMRCTLMFSIQNRASLSHCLYSGRKRTTTTWQKLVGICRSTGRALAATRTLLELWRNFYPPTVQFRDELGTVQPFRAKLHVQSGARLKFCKARSTPYAIKGTINLELDRLESAGIIQSVPYSDWAVPIVAVPKGDGRFRI